MANLSSRTGLTPVNTRISLANNTASNVQNFDGYDSQDLIGHVYIDGTADYRAAVKITVIKNGAGTYEVAATDVAGDDISGSPIVSFSMSGSVLQATLPNITGFSSAYIDYHLASPKLSGDYPLSIDAGNIVSGIVDPARLLDGGGRLSLTSTTADLLTLERTGGVNTAIKLTNSGESAYIGVTDGGHLGVSVIDANLTTSSTAFYVDASNYATYINSRGSVASTEGALHVYKSQVSNTEFLNFDTGTGEAYIGGIRRSGTTQTPTFFSGSDRRIKENFSEFPSVLSKLNQIKLYEYSLKAEEGSKGHGPIAQELTAIFPEKVVKTDDGQGEDLPKGTKPWSVSHDWSYELIKAIQEQQAIIESLKTRIEQLEESNTTTH